jgi:hypothetical protein
VVTGWDETSERDPDIPVDDDSVPVGDIVDKSDDEFIEAPVDCEEDTVEIET